MKDILTRPIILHSTPSNFTDVSDALCDFSQDTATITMSTNDAIYIGFEKPINSLFCWPSTPSTSNRSLTVSLYDSTTSSWNSVSSIDDTKGFTRAGFVQWILPTDHQQVTCNVNSISNYWSKITVSAATSATVFRAISGIFSDDNELVKEFPKIMDASFLLGQSNHFLIHETCRNDIVQYFRRKGMKRLGNDCYWKKFSHWDIMDIDEIKTAATYLALSKIFNNVSNSAKEGDNWTAKSREYKKAYDKAIDVAYLTWDQLSNGAINESQARTAELSFSR